MPKPELFRLIARASVAGLAVAFVVLMIWPDALRRDTAPETSPPPPLSPPMEAPAISSPLATDPVSYASAVERAAPAVVNINTAKVVTEQRNPLLDDPFFRQFFGQRDGNMMLRPRQHIERSLGSGVITSPAGYILTNLHVIRGADEIQVSLRDGRTVEARVIGSDPDTDLAVLKIDVPNPPTIALGNSEKLRVGDVVLAIGNPFGVGQTVTFGIVSATGRQRLGISTYENFIQTDAAINPGNSGGALIDAQGRLIGINTAIFSRSGGYQGVGFAIPMSLARPVLDQIIERGRPVRGWLGVEAHPVQPNEARALGLPEGEGMMVVGVTRDGPAHRAGVRPGDVIRTIDGAKADEVYDTVLRISNLVPGKRVPLTIRRDGADLTLVAIAAERPVPAAR